MKRLLPVLVLLVAVVAAAVVLRGEDDRYAAGVVLADSGGLRKGSNVRVNGAPAGRVTSLELDDADRAVAEIRLDDGAAPLGRDAKALVQADGFFGERYLELTPGDRAKPAPSGTVIPLERSAVSTRLDDVVDALDVDARQALQVFLREQGVALVGRGKDLNEVLQALPPGLNRTGELIDQFARDNEALGRLVERSDRVVAEVAGERKQLGRMVAGAGRTLDALGSRREGLRETVRRAPATLRSARRTLVSLEQAAVPLEPAARGLRATAPSLTQVLRELPAFTADAVPALQAVSRVAPRLQQLADGGTPVVRRLAPLAQTLTAYTRGALVPFTELLDKGAADTIGVLEGWARSTQGRDGSSRIFRFGATAGTDTFAALLQPAGNGRKARRGGGGGGGKRPAAAPAPSTDRPSAGERPRPSLVPKVPRLPGLAGALVDGAPALPEGADKTPEALLDFLLKP